MTPCDDSYQPRHQPRQIRDFACNKLVADDSLLLHADSAIGVGSFSILGGGGKLSEANFNTGGGGIVKCTYVGVAHTHTHTHTHTHARIRTHIHTAKCSYTHVCMYTHMYLFIYTIFFIEGDTIS